MQRDTHRVGVGDRGQSVFDFSIGVSLFLVVVAGALVFVPTAFGSFGVGTVGGTTDALVAQRGLDHLGGAVLGNGGAGSTFRTGCTLLFFNQQTSPNINPTPADCGLDLSVGVERNMGLSEGRSVNATLERDTDGDSVREILCWDESGDAARAVGSCGGTDDVVFSVGPNATANENFAVAERYGRVDGSDVYLVVRAW